VTHPEVQAWIEALYRKLNTLFSAPSGLADAHRTSSDVLSMWSEWEGKQGGEVAPFAAFLLSISIGLLDKSANGLVSLSASSMLLTLLTITTNFVLPLTIALAAADLFTAEQEKGTIKAVLLRPVSRIRVFTSKVLATFVYAVLFLSICFITSLTWGLVFDGILAINFTEVLVAYIISFVPMLPLILYNTAISQLSKSASGTVIFSLCGYIIMLVIGTVFPNVNPMLFSTYLGWYKLFIGAVLPLSSILNGTVLLAAYTLLLFAVGLWAFERKEY
jgi:ABC-2 type transport system permease protein